jgi:uncharacterized membrane protein
MQAHTLLATTPATLAQIATPLLLFCSTHVGLSAVREPIISSLGRTANQLGAVGTGATLPDWVLSSTDGSALWQTPDVAGRQLFRVLYSLVAAGTLAASFEAYAAGHEPIGLTPTEALTAHPAAFALATAAQAISIASLANPSPLSLVPAFTSTEDGTGLQRDDTLKLRPFGWTRVTRHPLILPVLPWSLGNAILAGAAPQDILLFGGLGIYAVVGCWAQDQRAKESAAVGTVFARGDLTNFYRDTSFVPAVALLDGRQTLREVAAEVNWSVLAGALLLSALIEARTVAAF